VNSLKSFSVSWGAVLYLALLLAPRVNAVQSLSLLWNPSTGTNVAGYHVHYWPEGALFEFILDAGTNTNFLVTGLQEGQIYDFAVMAYSDQGVESLPSNMITYTAPGMVRVALNPDPQGPALIQYSVAPGLKYQLLSSSDLMTWSVVQQIIPTNNAWADFKDFQVSSLNMRFYRLVWQDLPIIKPLPPPPPLPTGPSAPKASLNDQSF
jgi:Fibronectin type III domain